MPVALDVLLVGEEIVDVDRHEAEAEQKPKRLSDRSDRRINQMGDVVLDRFLDGRKIRLHPGLHNPNGR